MSECELCGGTGEVEVVGVGTRGCPACIEAEAGALTAERDAARAELAELRAAKLPDAAPLAVPGLRLVAIDGPHAGELIPWTGGGSVLVPVLTSPTVKFPPDDALPPVAAARAEYRLVNVGFRLGGLTLDGHVWAQVGGRVVQADRSARLALAMMLAALLDPR